MIGKPEAEIEITDDLVRHLLATQHVDLCHLPLVPLESGWDNAVYRLGGTMVVRLPRRELADQLVRNEQAWLPSLADQLPVSIPAPIRVGVPTDAYPWHWSIVPWFDGRCADLAAPSSRAVVALAEFLLRLHQPAPNDAPRNPFRGVPIQDRAAVAEERIARLKRKTDLVTPEIEKLWETGLAAPVANASRWLHGDLHAQNVLVVDGEISAIIDWGDITAGDVATDLPVIWGLFEKPSDRQRLLELYNPDQATYERAIAWAILFGVMLVDSGLINSARHAQQGKTLLTRLRQDA